MQSGREVKMYAMCIYIFVCRAVKSLESTYFVMFFIIILHLYYKRHTEGEIGSALLPSCDSSGDWALILLL